MKRIALLVAVPQELAPLARLLQNRTAAPSGLLCTRALAGSRGAASILLAATGVGSQKSGRTAASVIQTWKPDLIVMAGVAGALSAHLSVADVIAAETVIAGDTAHRPPVKLEDPRPGAKATLRRGVLLSLDRVLITATEKRDAAARVATPDRNRGAAIGDDSRPLAVEMETAGVIQAALREQVPWAAIRAVSDTAEESLPLDFNRLRAPDGDLPTSRVAFAAMTHPAAIPGLIRLGKNTATAAEALAGCLAAWLDTNG